MSLPMAHTLTGVPSRNLASLDFGMGGTNDTASSIMLNHTHQGSSMLPEIGKYVLSSMPNGHQNPNSSAQFLNNNTRIINDSVLIDNNAGKGSAAENDYFNTSISPSMLQNSIEGLPPYNQNKI